MSGVVFNLIKDEFVGELNVIRQLVNTFNSSAYPPKARIAAANSATLLVAATFEEFVREMAREYAKYVVRSAGSPDRIPKKLVSTVWKRSMENLARVSFDVEHSMREGLAVDAQAKFTVVHEFVKGDATQDVYRDLIHNENNMRPGQLNALFNVSGLSDVCTKMCDKETMLSFFGEIEVGKAHGKFLVALNSFFERRNSVAHALNPNQSAGMNQILQDLLMLESIGEALAGTLSDLENAST